MKSLFFLFLIFTLCKSSTAQYSRKYDKFNDEVVCTYNTPSISFNKYIKNKSNSPYPDTSYQTVFYIYDTYLTGSGTNAILLFSDKSKIELEGEVDVTYSHNNLYRYSFYTYDKEIVEKLSTISLLGFKLHIFEKNLPQSSRNSIITAAKKILSSR
ncbi:MAG: hypothetical protein KGP35_05345 [Bacteroidetes bacterium]|nr:hypothetical protein [Bacteroidota bacterium]